MATTSKRADYVRACYFTNWAQYRSGRAKFQPSDYVPGLCTHILYAFGWLNEDFTFRAYDPTDVSTEWSEGLYKQVNDLKKLQPGLITLLSVGGWTFGSRLFTALSKTKSGRQTFIQSAVDFVKRHGFDGLDIDWEFPTGQVDNYSLLLRVGGNGTGKFFEAWFEETRLAFDADAVRTGGDRLLLTAAVSAGDGTIRTSYDVGQCAKYLDLIFLMSYDFHGGWEMETYNHAPLYANGNEVHWQKVWNVDSSAQIWHKGGMPKEKIVIGVPTYARGWTLKDQANYGPGSKAKGPAKITKYVQESGVAAFYEICDMLKNGAKRMWDENMQAPYLVAQGDQWWGYDDVESVKNKMGWLKSKGYGGAFVWTLDFDDFNGRSCGGRRYPIIGTIAEELAGVRIDTDKPIMVEPAGTSTVSPADGTQLPGAPTVDSAALDTRCGRLADGAFFTVDDDRCAGQFYRCVHGAAHPFDCPDGLVFSAASGACVYRWQADCGDDEEEEGEGEGGGDDDEEPAAVGGAVEEIAAGSDVCRGVQSGFAATVTTGCAQQFVTCYKGEARLPTHKCPADFRFSPTTMACLPLEEAQCGSGAVTAAGLFEIATATEATATGGTTPGAPSPPALITTPAPSPSANSFKCTSDGFFASPQGCRQFVRCVHATAHHFDCPDGLHFSERLTVCTHPAQAECDR